MDNSAIERIATPDLTNDTLELLSAYGENDDVVFFLGRLIWQGQMTGCTPALAKIACDPSRGKYARIAAIRGVMAVGDNKQKDEVWEAIASDPSPLDRAILAELLDWTSATVRGIRLLLRTLEHAAPYERFNSTGLERALHMFIDRLPVMSDGSENHPLGILVAGLIS